MCFGMGTHRRRKQQDDGTAARAMDRDRRRLPTNSRGREETGVEADGTWRLACAQGVGGENMRQKQHDAGAATRGDGDRRDGAGGGRRRRNECWRREARGIGRPTRKSQRKEARGPLRCWTRNASWRRCSNSSSPHRRPTAPGAQSRGADTRPHKSPPRCFTTKRLDRSSAALSSKSASISVFLTAATRGQGRSCDGPEAQCRIRLLQLQDLDASPTPSPGTPGLPLRRSTAP
uniref:Uncharacterized protein n=1 Tax=Oryza punctata TaxID=4537 RepID=A0A0E0K367_ORYPU